MKADGLDSLHYVTDQTHGAVRLNVGDLRKLGLKVGWDPYDKNPHHGGVWGIGSRGKRRVREIATTVRRAEGETLPIPRRDPAAQAQSEEARSKSAAPSQAEARATAKMETVPVFASNGTVLLYDIYVVKEGSRTWIGSRRTIEQCRNTFDAHRRRDSP